MARWLVRAEADAPLPELRGVDRVGGVDLERSALRDGDSALREPVVVYAVLLVAARVARRAADGIHDVVVFLQEHVYQGGLAAPATAAAKAKIAIALFMLSTLLLSRLEAEEAG